MKPPSTSMARSRCLLRMAIRAGGVNTIDRLPTEAEWEYAARAGTTTLFSTGNTLPDYYLKNAEVTDFTAPKDKRSLQIGQTPANACGLYEMHGNVEEWVHDWYAPQASPSVDLTMERSG